jgi:diadenosine tetraphosphate (Ap4A) HIT family hydrolase
MDNLNPNYYLTAKERKTLSFPAQFLLNQKLFAGDMLDFGCGFGTDVTLLQEKGFNITGYDKHYFPTYPQQKFDTIICFYVLNVLLPEEQSKVLIELSQLIKPSGKVYIAVRRDLKAEGFRTHKIYQKQTYQCNVVLRAKSVFKNKNCEIYEYQHFNQIPRTNATGCPFCNPSADRTLLAESATAFALLDKHPVSQGHSLIIPKRHVESYFDLSFKEQAACIFLANAAKEILQKQFQPDGFNVGINIGEKAGQTIKHAHIHLIPRYAGDVDKPEVCP